MSVTGHRYAQCYLINAVFASILEKHGIYTNLVSGQLAGGFNDQQNGTFRFGYCQSNVMTEYILDHHVWCEDQCGGIYDATLRVMNLELQSTTAESVEPYLLAKNASVSSSDLKEYLDIMEHYAVGLSYKEIKAFHPRTLSFIAREMHKLPTPLATSITLHDS